MIDMLVTGIIRSVSAGVRFLQRAIMLSVGLQALVGIVHVTIAVLASILIRSTSWSVITSPVRSSSLGVRGLSCAAMGWAFSSVPCGASGRQ